jgi:phage FluMu protein Com
MQEIRCSGIVYINGKPSICNNLMLKADCKGTIQIACRKCKKVNIIEITPNGRSLEGHNRVRRTISGK